MHFLAIVAHCHSLSFFAAILFCSVKKNGYPDFMEKREDSKVYVSEKLLGVLYRRCRSLMFDFDIATEKRRGYK